MDARGKLASLEDATGLALFRALGPVCVFSVNYEEHTPAWGQPSAGGAAGSDFGNDLDEEAATEVVNTDHLRGLSPQISLQMDWEEDEQPTQRWNAGHLLAAFRPKAPPLVPPVVTPQSELFPPVPSQPPLMPPSLLDPFPSLPPSAAQANPPLVRRPANVTAPQPFVAVASPEVNVPGHTSGRTPTPIADASARTLRGGADGSGQALHGNVEGATPALHGGGDELANQPHHGTRAGKPPTLSQRFSVRSLHDTPQSVRRPDYLQPQAAPALPHTSDSASHNFRRALGARSARASRYPSWILHGALALALFGAGLATHVILNAPEPSSVVLEITPSDAEVTLDGEQLPGRSPHSQAGLPAGEHVLVVKRDGFVEHRQVFMLATGEAKILPAISLVALKPVRKTGFTITTTPPGAEIRLDGRSLDQLTPARVTGVTPGFHTLQLRLDGFDVAEQTVTVRENTVFDLSDIVLQRSTGADEPEKLGRNAIRAARVAERLRQRRANRGSLFASDEPSGAPAAPSSDERVPQPSAAEAGKTGTLQINSRPWSNVYVDERMVGSTPQVALQLPAGRHTVKLVNPSLKMAKTLTVHIQAGHTVTRVETLGE